MDLIFIAHRAEASAFFQNHPTKKIKLHSSNIKVYQSTSFILFLTGQGPFHNNSLTSCIEEVAENYNIQRVFNIGTCGTLKYSHKKEETYWVKSCELWSKQSNEDLFSGDFLGKRQVDNDYVSKASPKLLTLSKPLHHHPTAWPEDHEFSLIDCEAGHILECLKNSKLANLELKILKLISDHSAQELDFMYIKENSARWSQELLDKYQGLIE